MLSPFNFIFLPQFLAIASCLAGKRKNRGLGGLPAVAPFPSKKTD